MKLSLRSLFSTHESEPVAPERVVGIDVGSTSMKVVELARTARGPVLKTYGELQFGPYGDQPLGMPTELKAQKLSQALVDVLREAGVVAKQSVLAMPLAAGFVTIIPMVVKEGEDIANRIPIEARKYIPVPLDDVTLDWVTLETEVLDETKQEVLLVALQNESIATYGNLLSSVSLPTFPSELEIFSAIRGVAASTQETCAIIDIGAKTSKLYIVRNGSLVRIHRVQAGGSAITQKLATLLHCSYLEAENIKRSKDMSSAQATDLKNATSAVLQGALQEFKRVIDQYETATSVPMSRIELIGGVVVGDAIAPYVTDVLQRKATVAQPFSQVGYPAFMEDTMHDVGPIFTNSLGAALRLCN